MFPVPADFIDLPSSVQDAKYGNAHSHNSVVVTTYTGSEFELLPVMNDKIYRVKGLIESRSSAVLISEFTTNSKVSSTWNEINDSPDDLYVDLIPTKKFKMKMKISKISKPIPKFFLN